MQLLHTAVDLIAWSVRCCFTQKSQTYDEVNILNKTFLLKVKLSSDLFTNHHRFNYSDVTQQHWHVMEQRQHHQQNNFRWRSSLLNCSTFGQKLPAVVLTLTTFWFQMFRTERNLSQYWWWFFPTRQNENNIWKCVKKLGICWQFICGHRKLCYLVCVVMAISGGSETSDWLNFFSPINLVFHL